MALIRPLKTNGKDLVDIRETEGAVTSNIINSSTNSAINPRYLGAPQDDGVKRAKSDKEDESIYTKTSFINLPLPVLNYFTAGNSFSAFSKIISEAYGDDVKVEDIVSGKIIFNKKTGESMSSIGSSDVFTDMVYTPDILIGAQYLEYLLNQIDIDEVIIKTLVTFSRGVLKKIGVEVKEVNVTVKRGAGEYQILDDYYMDTNAEFNVEAFGRKLDEELQALLNDYENPLLYMFSVRDRGMSVLTDQIQYKIFVLPYGFRPNFKKRKDPLTKAYQSLFRVSVDLENRMRQYGTKVSDIRMGYIELVKAVKYVTVDSSQGYVSEYKSIAESIIGKHGLIRDRMMGVRVDYSGRSVITVDPTMSVDTIGIPEDMAPKLMELTCLGEMETESFNKDGLLRRKAAFKQKAIEILNKSFIVPGRQPTLYKHGLQAFRVKVVKGNAIVLNPLTCPSFNADFDGDQMHVITPIGEGAIKDVEHLMLNTKNLFYSKSGECHIAPRQEIIYGLWLSSVVTPDGHRDKSKSILDSETLLDDICEERVNIYDTVVFNGKTMTVGEYGIRKCFPEAIRTVDIGSSPITVTGKMNCKAVTEKWFKDILIAHHIVFLYKGQVKIADKDMTNNRLTPEQRRYYEAAKIDLFESGKYGKFTLITDDLVVETMEKDMYSFLKHNRNCQLWVIDYAGLAKSRPVAKFDKRYDGYEIIVELYRRAKEIAKTADIGVFIINQFNDKGVEASEQGKPILPGYTQGGFIASRQADYDLAMTMTQAQKLANLCMLSTVKERAAVGFKNQPLSRDLAVSIYRQIKKQEGM